ncbi:hypothetical protein AG1IA_03048 [Rhizoctonia solani AG-1 IA]|uniref:Uncharacterized protein n=1 Tax=Thanatephorus cucumeris (strain AG1-IA) TaxID=983506 RepID=L8X2R9_THACA|nr:hypothetical protein AG1IA_03048 [Rhizoctonia solani AG-1 IA]
MLSDLGVKLATRGCGASGERPLRYEGVSRSMSASILRRHYRSIYLSTTKRQESLGVVGSPWNYHRSC